MALYFSIQTDNIHIHANFSLKGTVLISFQSTW